MLDSLLMSDNNLGKIKQKTQFNYGGLFRLDNASAPHLNLL